MPKTRPPYAPEFRRRLIELVRKGRTPEEVSRQFEPSAQDGLTADEQEELRRLRRENRLLREEREILKTAAAWFARETGSIPSKDSSS